MKRLQPVIWTKGTFLSPQHLQLQDRFLENLLQFHLESLSFRPWGFRTLQISQEALAAGSFGISSASGILPDGLLFDIPASDGAPPPKQLADCFEPDQTTLDLFLAVPQYRERGLNVATSARQGGARYRAEIELFRDENTGLSEKPVQMARKNLRLLVEGEALDGYSACGWRACAAPRPACSSSTRASCRRCSTSRPAITWSAIARRLVEILSARSSAIAGLRRQKNQSLADFTAADIANFWLLYTVNTAFPAFRHLFETRGGHPEALYAAMLALAGALTTFSTTIHPRDLPTYDHDDLGACFTELDEKLRIAARNRGAEQLRFAAAQAGAAFHLRHVARQRQVPGEHQDVPGGERRNQQGGNRRQGAATGEGLFRQPHRAPGAPGAARRAADLRGLAAERHSHQAQLPVLQPEPVGRWPGRPCSGRATWRPTCRAICPIRNWS